MADTRVSLVRKCSQCGVQYDVRTDGQGGGSARVGETPETFPFDEVTHTGIKVENAHWFHGAHCSDECYDEAYYEPPTPGYNW